MAQTPSDRLTKQVFFEMKHFLDRNTVDRNTALGRYAGASLTCLEGERAHGLHEFATARARPSIRRL